MAETTNKEVLDVSVEKPKPEDCTPEAKEEIEKIIWVNDQYPDYPTISKSQKPFVCNFPRQHDGHRLSIYFLDSKKMDFLRVHLLLYFKGRPTKPHILIDVGSLFLTS